MRVLFVCLGNICRSPTALAATREALVAAGLDDRMELDSAGTGDWHVGNPPDERMRRAGRDVGLEIDGAARQVLAGELERWDLVLAMDRRNLAALRAMAPARLHDRIRLFLEFLPDDAARPPAGAEPGLGPDEVPDPYYGGAAGFAGVVALCRAAASGLVDELAAALDGGGRVRR